MEARALVLGNATSFGEILSMVPHAYMEAVREPFRKLSQTASKLVSVEIALDNLNRHVAVKTWPPPLMGVHFPKFEVTAEFEATKPGVQAELISQYDSYRSDCLGLAVRLKTDERTWIRKQLSPETYLPPLLQTVHERWTQVQEATKKPKFTPNEAGQQTLDGFVNNPVSKREYDHLVENLPTMCSRIILIEEHRLLVEQRKRSQKAQLKAVADVEMGDAEMSAKAVSDIVDRKIAGALKKMTVAVGLEDSSFLLELYADPVVLGKRLYNTEDAAQTKRQRAQEGQSCDSGSSTTQWKAREKEIRGQRWQEDKEAVTKIIREGLRYETYWSWPDDILTLPTPIAVRLVLRNASTEVVQASRYRSSVHTGPGVFLPDLMQAHISSGARYLLYVTPKKRIIESAWTDFCDRLRWRLYWITKIATGEANERPYDPDYEIPHDRHVCEDKIPYIEKGLEQGWAWLEGYLNETVPSLPRRQKGESQLVDAKAVLQFCKKEGYMILPTDKNLGQSVVTRKWFIEKINNLLSDRASYELVSKERAFEILEAQKLRMNTMADNAISFYQHEQLAKYLRSNIPMDDEPIDKFIPNFYGIPKIHKEPVKMRPIVPCHSAMQNPAAKFASKHLKPVVERLSFCIKGTKDMATKLNSLKLIRGRRYFLVGFDLVAFYTNIPLEDCLNIVQNMYRIDAKPTLSDRAMMRQALNVAFKNLLFKFDGQYLLQKNGIAMGVAASPDVANIYAGVHEEACILPAGQHQDRIAFYGRYIDDGFMIVYGEDKDEVLTFCKNTIKIGELELTWEVSETSLAFLDMLIYIEPSDKSIQWKPFRKSRNNLERIPFASHHPFDIKRGTFYGEMTRMAILSSNAANYIDAVKDLSSIYIARGYPVSLVKKWVKEQTSKRWHNRFGKPVVPRVPSLDSIVDDSTKKLLVLKTHFNPVWEPFNVHELARIITEEWVRQLSNQESRISNLVRSGMPGRRRPAPVSSFLGERSVGPRDQLVPGRNLNAVPVVLADMADLPASEVILRKEDFWRSISIEYLKPMGRGWNSQEIVRVLDVRKIGLCDAKWIVSRKRTTNLSDIFNRLKRDALSEGSSPFEDVQSLQELLQEVTPDTGHEHVPEYEDMLVDA